MKLAYFSLTPGGDRLCAAMAQHMPGTVVTREVLLQEGCSFAQMTARMWPLYDGLIFVMASGIVVRTIAPLLVSKTSDPAVVVMDARGQYAVSLLSGHLGGANELAQALAKICHGQAVITTGTDVEHTLAFDVFAKKNQLRIENIAVLKYISAAMIEKAPAGLWCPWPADGIFPSNVQIQGNKNCVSRDGGSETPGDMPWVFIGHDYDVPEALKTMDRVLYLRPKNLYVGVGCKRGTAFEAMEAAFSDFLRASQVNVQDVAGLCTIELKKDEPAIVSLAKKYCLELKIIDHEQIRALEAAGAVQVSEFVRSVTQVGSVCEACALAAAQNAGENPAQAPDLSLQKARKIRGKTIYPGMTFALAQAPVFFQGLKEET